MAIDVSTTSEGISLPPEVSKEIITTMQEASAVQQLARRTDLPGQGSTIPVVTGDPQAEWVSETEEAPVSRPKFGYKQMTPHVLQVVVPFSNKFKRDLETLYEACVERLPGALAQTFDATVFGAAPSPGEHFAQLDKAAEVALSPGNSKDKSTYKGLVEAYATVAKGLGTLNGWALSAQAKALLLGQTDEMGRPLMLDSIQDGTSLQKILGEQVLASRAAYIPGTPNVIGFAGDWTKAIYGITQDVSISFSEASITDGAQTITVGGETVSIPKQINLWQRDMFAVKARVEIGFQATSDATFVKLTDKVRS
jgi:HK97 family phage major capsid protein